MNNPNKTASPQGPDPEAPDGLNAPTPDPGGLSPDLYPETRQAATPERRESKPSITQNPMTPRVSDPSPERSTPTSPLPGHPDDPIPWSADPERRPDMEIPEKRLPQEVPAKPRRDVPETEPARAGQDVQRADPYAAKSDGSTKPSSKAKGSRSKREIKQTPPTQHR